MGKPRILFVDDDPDILSAYQRRLRKHYQVKLAASAAEGLAAFQAPETIAVVVSDLRMPGMDGIAFLEQVRTLSPDTVRIMLTAFADIDAAVSAVNKSKIFCFLTKPCPAEDLEEALTSALRQYQLHVAERELLRGTVRGTIKLLTGLLAMVNPEAFGKSSRVKRLAVDIGEYMGLGDLWRLELAAMLSQIGCAALPPRALRQAYLGAPLSGGLAFDFAMHPKIAADLLANIPRLREVSEIVGYQEKHFDGGGLPADGRSGEAIPLAARILKVALDFDSLENLYAQKLNSENPVAAAFERMRAREGWYDPAVLEALESMANLPDGFDHGVLDIAELKTGMLLDQDVHDVSGDLVFAKGLELNAAAIKRLRSILPLPAEPTKLRVLIPPPDQLAVARMIDT